MPSTDPRVDAYIAAAAPFARPILTQLREAVHAACPEVEETIRWRMPSFTHRGRPLAGMAAFKAHASFALWNRDRMRPPEERDARDGMGELGKLAVLQDLPNEESLRAMITAAAARIESGEPAPGRSRAVRPEPQVPPALCAALAGDPVAKATFDAFPPSCRRDYCEWVAEAKRDDTLTRRVTQTLQWLREGKRRNWQYEKC